MSGRPVAAPGGLDPASRRTLVRVGYRLGTVSFLVLWPYLFGSRLLATALDLLSAFGALAGLFCMVVALLLREKPGRGALGHWDEALVYFAVNQLAQLASDCRR